MANFSEKKLFWLVAIIALIMVLIPSLIGWLRVINGQFAEYIPYNIYTTGDLNVYFSYIRQASQGHFLFQNLFTSEAQSPRFFQPLWLILGLFAVLSRLPISAAYLVFQILSGLFLLWVILRFLKWLGLSENQRKWVFPLIVFSGGFGFFFLRWHEFLPYQYIFPTDLMTAEATTFSTLYHSPLFPLSQALTILTFQFFLEGFQKRKKKYLFFSGLSVLILSFTHTYDLVTIAVVLSAYGLILLLRNEIIQPKDLWRYIGSGLLLLLFALPCLLYYFFIVKNEPALAGWLRQNICITPSIWSVLLSYGLLIPLMLVGASVVVKEKNDRLYLLLTWLVASSILIYLPHLTFQRRLINGLHLPLAILAGLGLRFIYLKVKERSSWLSKASVALLGLFLVLTPAGIIARDGIYINEQVATDTTRNFITTEEKESYDFLVQTVNPKEVIYSHPWTGNILASFNLRVFLGHGHQTVNWTQKRKELNEFFNIWNEDSQISYLKESNISYLYYGPLEKGLGPWPPDKMSWLENIWQNNEITIYKLK